ncbi:hypothetical protein ACQPXB_19820 [Amycolatopsis sp. CA-161197]|uniref:hypothetical protein n=1 Tax=Amycolatopsis sp. CA-161197 TaxID=3239922 RepID=UPI003D8EA5BE
MRIRAQRARSAAAVVAVALTLTGLGAAPAVAAPAATSQDFGPTVITGVPHAPDLQAKPPEKPTQKVVPLATISTQLDAGATAYVYSELRAWNADQANLIDNEIRCSGAGASNVVMGENVLPATNPNPALRDITIVNRFLVTASTTGALNCTLYLRTASTSPSVAQETVAGTLRFASTAVGGDVNGTAMQRSLPAGNLPVTTSTVAPIVNATMPAGYRNLAVIADVEYHRGPEPTPDSKIHYSTARFTLTVTTSGGPNCASAPVAQTEETVVRGVNHAAIPLYTKVPVNPGCTQLSAKVTTTHLGGNPGTVGGAAPGLTDQTGVNGSTPNHTSAMTHLFVVPS